MKRSKENIYENILKFCEKPSGITRIVYSCNLNFRAANIHIEELFAAGLIEELPRNQENRRGIYQTSEKGIQALEHIKGFRDLLKHVK